MFKQIAALLRRKPVEPEINYTINLSLPEIKKKPVAKKLVVKTVKKPIKSNKPVTKKTVINKKPKK